MKLAGITAALFLALNAVSVRAGPSDLATLPIGNYVCAIPGDATGPATRRLPEADFSITNASSYAADGSGGNYLLIDNGVQMTSGPRKGQRFRRTSNTLLRQLGPNGEDTSVRCVRQTRNND